MSRSAIIFFTSLILMFAALKSNAQSIDSDSSTGIKKEFAIPSLITDFIHDEGRIYSSPFHIKKNDFKIIIPALAVTGILLLCDHPINNAVEKMTLKNQWLHDSGNAISNGGEPLFTVGVAATFFAGGLIFNNYRAEETGLLAGEALVHTTIATVIIKTLTGRARPNDPGEGRFEISERSLKNSLNNSFPSFHSSTAFALATVIAVEYKDVKSVPIIAYTSAGLVGLSRIVLQKHWSADVFAGGLLGYGIGKLVLIEHNKKWHLTPTSSVTGKPSFLFTMRF